MKIKNRKLYKIIGLTVIGFGAILPLASCSYYKSWNKNDTIDDQNQDNNDNNNDNGNGNSSGYKGTIDTSIANSKIVSETDLSLDEKNANDYGLVQNYNDFASNGDFSTIDGKQSEIKDDIIGFLNILYFSNNKQISITNSNVDNLKIDTSSTSANADENNNNALKLNSSRITFNLTATISNGDFTTNISFPWGQVTLSPNSSQTLKISVDNQVMEPSINVMNEKYYLGWKVEKASATFGDKTTNVSNLDLTYNSFSKVFYVVYNNLSNVNSYFDLQKQYLPDLSKSLTTEKFKDLFASSVDNQQEDYFFYADMANSLITLIGNDTPVDVMLKTASKYLIQILTHMNIIPSGFEDILIEALYGESGDTSSVASDTFIDVLYKNKDKINEILKTYLGSAYDVIEPIIADIKPNMTTSDKGFQSIQTYVDMLLNNITNDDDKKTLTDIIYGDILGVQGYSSAKSLWDIITTRYEFIIKIIQSNVSGFSKDLSENILKLLNMIFKTSTDNKYSSIVDSLFSSKDNKQSFLNILCSLIPGISEQVKSYLTILIVDNDSLNKDNILAMLKSFVTFFNTMFAYKEGATSETEYKQRYQNLSFSNSWESASVDNTNMTATYSYKLNISLTKKIDLNLQPIKNLISKDSFNKLLENILKEVAGSLSSIAATALPNLQVDLFNFIPDVISFGIDNQNSNLIYKYTGSNEKIWFEPIKKNDDFYNGFSIGYNMNVFYNDSKMWESITKNFDNKNFVRDIKLGLIPLGTYTLKYYDFWKSILENVMMRSYNISGRFSTSDYSEKIANTLTYNSNYYYTNLTFTNSSSNVDIKTLNSTFSTTDAKNYSGEKNNVSWKNNPSEEIVGKSLITTEQNRQLILSKMYEIQTSKNKNFNNLNYNCDFDFDPLLNCVIPLEFMAKIDIAKVNLDYKINLNISAFTSTIYFPVNFYDITNKKLISSLTKNYSSFTVTTEQKK